MFANSRFWWQATGFFPGVSRKQPGDESDSVAPPLMVVPHLSLDEGKEFSVKSVDDQMSKLFDSYKADDDGDTFGGDTKKFDDSDGSKDSEKSAPSVPDSNSCHGISGDYWVMHRDTAAVNVQDFCKQIEKDVTYNKGSVDELELSVENPDDDKKGPQDAPDCVGRFMRAIIDSCDYGDTVNNPWNYKFGGTLTTGDGWKYTMIPLSKQVNDVSCDVSYKVFYDGFEIRGKNLPWKTFGAEGEGLRDQISGCAKLTKWKFEWTPKDCCFEWYAGGRLPIGQKSCIGHALQSAGGASADNCKGAGKRNIARSDSIDSWPGYGDEGRHVFGTGSPEKRDSISSWPGYGDEGRHVFQGDDTAT